MFYQLISLSLCDSYKNNSQLHCTFQQSHKELTRWRLASLTSLEGSLRLTGLNRWRLASLTSPSRGVFKAHWSVYIKSFTHSNSSVQTARLFEQPPRLEQYSLSTWRPGHHFPMLLSSCCEHYQPSLILVGCSSGADSFFNV